MGIEIIGPIAWGLVVGFLVGRWRRRRNSPRRAMLEAMRRVRLRPGDALLVRFGGRLTQHDADGVRRRVEALFPGHRVLILEERASLEIVTEAASLNRFSL